MKRPKLFSIIVIIISFLLNCYTTAEAKPELFATGLGKVYGLAFDQHGDLFAVGSDDLGSVLWKIPPDGKKELYTRIDDPQEAMSVAGISLHSQYLAQVAIDQIGMVWISSFQYGACFIITSGNRDAIKLYLNTDYSLSLQDEEYPYGVTWDGVQKKILVVTNGPKDKYGTEHIHHIHTINFNTGTGDYEDLYSGGESLIMFTKNKGIIIPFMGRGLIKSNNSPLYFLGDNGIYLVDKNGDFFLVGNKQETKSFFGGAVDEKGNIYLTANKKNYKIGTDDSEGCILRLTTDGIYATLTTAIKEPLGMVINKGYLYITDRSNGTIVRMKI